MNIAYEILLMLDPDLPEERQTEIITRARQLIEKGGGTWQSHDVWGRGDSPTRSTTSQTGRTPVPVQAEPETLDELAASSRSRTASCVTSRSGGRGRGTSAPPPMPAADDRQPAYAEANVRSHQDSSSHEDSEEES